MKFVVVAQLPRKLCEILLSMKIDSIHVEELPNGVESSDIEIIDYADDNDFIVVTKDADFYHGHLALHNPKKLLIIATGNVKNRVLFDICREYFGVIPKLFKEYDFLELTMKGITIHE